MVRHQEHLLDYKIRRVPNRRNNLANDDAYNPQLGDVKHQLVFLVKLANTRAPAVELGLSCVPGVVWREIADVAASGERVKGLQIKAQHVGTQTSSQRLGKRIRLGFSLVTTIKFDQSLGSRPNVDLALDLQ